ncbi:hypothetical protein SAMN05421636_109147 [Pricia antarctica]|uniref:Uncharacterized protein n=1 Tax=Pricia antarctica TaxID=641691 RepID=A0A1G7HF53_9FLAO|nr:hypothetical protein [Pricia antarctica]SDE99090.1 hypothetical protein SAMN05421636_109147 [Pricia antarctica]
MDTIKKIIGLLTNVRIISAITWAAVMIGCSLVLSDTEYSMPIFTILIVGYTLHFLLLSRESTENEKAINQK